MKVIGGPTPNLPISLPFLAIHSTSYLGSHLRSSVPGDHQTRCKNVQKYVSEVIDPQTPNLMREAGRMTVNFLSLLPQNRVNTRWHTVLNRTETKQGRIPFSVMQVVASSQGKRERETSSSNRGGYSELEWEWAVFLLERGDCFTRRRQSTHGSGVKQRKRQNLLHSLTHHVCFQWPHTLMYLKTSSLLF